MGGARVFLNINFYMPFFRKIQFGTSYITLSRLSFSKCHFRNPMIIWGPLTMFFILQIVKKNARLTVGAEFCINNFSNFCSTMQILHISSTKEKKNYCLKNIYLFYRRNKRRKMIKKREENWEYYDIFICHVKEKIYSLNRLLMSREISVIF